MFRKIRNFVIFTLPGMAFIPAILTREVHLTKCFTATAREIQTGDTVWSLRTDPDMRHGGEVFAFCEKEKEFSHYDIFLDMGVSLPIPFKGDDPVKIWRPYVTRWWRWVY